MSKINKKINSIIIILTIAFFSLSNMSFAGNDTLHKNVDTKEEKIYTKVDKMPGFKGGDKELIKFIVSNVKYPEDSKSKSIQGTVLISFIVNSDGTLSDYNVEKSVSKELDDEALRVLMLMPEWIPGLEKGKAVKVKMQLPIEFRLN